MPNITSAAELKNAIHLVEAKQALKQQELKEEFHYVLKSTLKDVASSPYLIENIIETGVGMATGYLSKKLVVGTSTGIVRNVLGSLLQFGITNAVSKRPGAIRSISNLLSQYFHRSSESKSEK